MTIKSNTSKLLTISFVIAIMVLLGIVSEISAQSRDPFAKPGWARTREVKGGVSGTTGKTGPAIIPGIPPIDQRIDYYKRLREVAAVNGQPLPKVTSVLSLNEMSVTGIFKTPRGYAAMVEAMPIQLSYTIYPGEKFFDGQLVAVEENRLVFRKVTKVANGKFVSSVENKLLRKYTEKEQIQGTAPMGAESARSQQGGAAGAGPLPADKMSVVSPLEEMNKQASAPEEKPKSASKAKKPVKVAKKGK